MRKFKRHDSLARLAAAIIAILLTLPALAAPLFSVPTTAMMPTLGEGDVLLAIPPARDLRRGDIVVYFTDGSHQISRVIALGTETIEVRSGQVFIGGAAMRLTSLAQPIEQGCPPLVTEGKKCHFVRETTPEGTSYVVIDSVRDGYFDNVGPVTVPKDHFFVMSDNRDNAVDSRYEQRGPIASSAIIGLVQAIVTTTRLAPDRAERLDGFPHAE